MFETLSIEKEGGFTKRNFDNSNFINKNWHDKLPTKKKYQTRFPS